MNALSIGHRPITCSEVRSKAPERQDAAEVATYSGCFSRAIRFCSSL